MQLMDLVGTHVLSGIEVGQDRKQTWGYRTELYNFVKFTLDGVTYFAAEDPDDGYRSYMEELRIVDEPCKISLPNIQVVCTMRDDDSEYRWRNQADEILSFVDAKNGKEILAIGTANTADYYPWCVMEYKPENMACNGAKMEG